MSAKKRAAQQRKTSKKALPAVPIPLPQPLSGRAARTTQVRTGTARVWGWPDDEGPPKGQRLIRVPNPWPPGDIVTLITVAVTSASLAPLTYKFIAAWIEHRKAKKIRIKRGEYEIEVQGGVSEKELGRVLSQFRKFTKELEDEEPKIILPRGVDRSFSLDLILGKEEKKGGEK